MFTDPHTLILIWAIGVAVSLFVFGMVGESEQPLFAVITALSWPVTLGAGIVNSIGQIVGENLPAWVTRYAIIGISCAGLIFSAMLVMAALGQ